jgi:hypothetical protein
MTVKRKRSRLDRVKGPVFMTSLTRRNPGDPIPLGIYGWAARPCQVSPENPCGQCHPCKAKALIQENGR